MACIREAAKKVIFLMTVPLRGGGGKGLVIEKKNVFIFFTIFAQKTALLVQNGLNSTDIKKFFFGFPEGVI